MKYRPDLWPLLSNSKFIEIDGEFQLMLQKAQSMGEDHETM